MRLFGAKRSQLNRQRSSSADRRVLEHRRLEIRKGPRPGAEANILGLAGELPSNRLAAIWRHAVALCDRRGDGRRAHHLPYAALRAGFTSTRSRADRLFRLLHSRGELKKRHALTLPEGAEI